MIVPNDDNSAFFSMIDLTAGMKKPCLLDIKLGSQVYNPKKVER